MTRWRLIDQTWCTWPSRPSGLIEMIGGSYLSATPHISYKRLLEGLAEKGLAIHAWSYVPGFDHQFQANQAWKSMRLCRKKLEERTGSSSEPIRLGHSLGCKLHLLAPDGGRTSQGLIALGFNNFAAERSIPMLSELAPKFGLVTEFSPSPEETMRLVETEYSQKKNLLIAFSKDNLDQSESLLNSLKIRSTGDSSNRLILKGNHLTPASIGIRKELLGKFTNYDFRASSILKLIQIIHEWTCRDSGS